MRALATKPPDSPLNEPQPQIPDIYLRTGCGTWRSIGEIVDRVLEHLVVIEERGE